MRYRLSMKATRRTGRDRTIDVTGASYVEPAKPGQPIRFEPEKSRFEPLTIEGWQETYYAAPIDFGGGVPGSQPRNVGEPR